MAFSIKSYFFDLGFYPEDDFHLGPRDRKLFIIRTMWESGVYFFLALGVFCREIVYLKPLRVDFSNVGYLTALAALIVATIPFPIIMRRMTKLRSKGGLLYATMPFAYGLTFNVAAHLLQRS